MDAAFTNALRARGTSRAPFIRIKRFRLRHGARNALARADRAASYFAFCVARLAHG